MRTKQLILIIAFVLFKLTVHAYDTTQKIRKESDSSDSQKFKKFSEVFFKAIKRNDTAFLKEHILFPIKNSSFYIFNKNLEGKAVTSQIVLKNVSKYFPNNLINRFKTADYSISKHPAFETKYIITLYIEENGVETNYSWIFILKQKNFCLANFRAEAG